MNDISFDKGEGKPHRATLIIDKEGVLRYKCIASSSDDDKSHNIDELLRLLKELDNQQVIEHISKTIYTERSVDQKKSDPVEDPRDQFHNNVHGSKNAPSLYRCFINNLEKYGDLLDQHDRK